MPDTAIERQNRLGGGPRRRDTAIERGQLLPPANDKIKRTLFTSASDNHYKRLSPSGEVSQDVLGFIRYTDIKHAKSVQQGR